MRFLTIKKRRLIVFMPKVRSTRNSFSLTGIAPLCCCRRDAARRRGVASWLDGLAVQRALSGKAYQQQGSLP
jgi:hypothetical protein